MITELISSIDKDSNELKEMKDGQSKVDTRISMHQLK